MPPIIYKAFIIHICKFLFIEPYSFLPVPDPRASQSVCQNPSINDKTHFDFRVRHGTFQASFHDGLVKFNHRRFMADRSHQTHGDSNSLIVHTYQRLSSNNVLAGFTTTENPSILYSKDCRAIQDHAFWYGFSVSFNTDGGKITIEPI